jgi:hypothetical protein
VLSPPEFASPIVAADAPRAILGAHSRQIGLIIKRKVVVTQRLRCGACGQRFTAQEPEGVGPEKYDETAAAMIALLQ